LTNITVNENKDLGIFVAESSNNNFTNIIANLNQYGIKLMLSSVNNIIKDSDLSLNAQKDVYLETSANNIFLNTTYDINKEYVYFTDWPYDKSTLIRKWYFDAQVVDINSNPLQNASVFIYGNLYSGLTNSTGNIPQQELIEYINEGELRDYQHTYAVQVSKAGYNPLIKLVYLTENLKEIIILEQTFQDSDNDGVPDSEDNCPNTILPELFEKLNTNHYGDIDGDRIFETKKKKEIINSKYTLTSTHGCSCKQILELKPGKNNGELLFGCTKATIENFINKKGGLKIFLEYKKLSQLQGL